MDLKGYIKQQFIIERFNKIDNEIICEALESKVLKEVAKQLSDGIKREKELKKDDNYPSLYNQSFKKIFGSGYGFKKVNWSEIKDSDVDKIEAGTWSIKKEEVKNKKLLNDALKDKSNNIIITQNPENGEYEWVILSWGEMIKLYQKNKDSKYNHGDYAGAEAKYRTARTLKDWPLKDKLEVCLNKTLYIIDCTGKYEAHDKLQTDRRNSKQGMIDMDPYSLEQIARANRERYKKIIAQNVGKRQHNDKLIDRCKTIIDQVSDWISKLAKNPERYADIYYDLQRLSQLVYDKKRYVNSSGRTSAGYYSGNDGLLPTLMTYTDALRYLLDKSNNYPESHRKDMETAKKKLEETCKKCEDILAKIS